MCGIFAYLGSTYKLSDLQQFFNIIKPRGPDNSVIEFINSEVCFGFHRLCINDISSNGNQPISKDQITLICNGEIYNHLQLIKEHQFKTSSTSDCEVILHLYQKFGIEKTIKLIDGVFSFVLYDRDKDIIYSGRDPFGVRPMFYGKKNNETFFSSEIKGISELATEIIPFPPGHYWDSMTKEFKRYFYDTIDKTILPYNDEILICQNIKKLLTEAVDKRLMSDRPIGCLLSGGLDSSLIAALVAKHYPPNTLETFSIGLKNSTDLYYAKIVADFIKSKHHHVELTENDFLDAIEEVIYKIESYDTTTVRASVGNYLISKYISQNSNCVVIYNGDGSDEVCGSYLYLKNAPTPNDFHNECLRLLNEIHYFDVLRSDRSISENGLEPRTPFLDTKFVKYYLSIDSKLRSSNEKMEKYLLRKSFEGILPKEVLWRRKEAFSDGVSGKERSWYEIIQDLIEEKISDEEFKNYKKNMYS